jgi:molecular chaperone GrpE
MTDSVTNEEELATGEVGTEPEAGVGTAPAGGAEDAPALETAPAEEPPAQEDPSALQAELAELRDKHLRLVAEFSNYRRRSEQERLGAWSRAQGDLLAKFLDVLDDLSRVAELDPSNATTDAIMEGVDLVEKKFLRILEDVGVEIIDPIGQRFDPARMEGVVRVSAESAEQDDSVAQVLQRGYALKGQLVRPARVAVYKHG